MVSIIVGGIWYLALFLESFLYGLYSGIFGIYLRYETSKQDTDKSQKTLFYSMCALYVTSAFLFFGDIADTVCQIRPGCLFSFSPNNSVIIETIQTALFACSDFIAQFILIYRCWIVWGRNIRVVIIPSILAFAFFGIWIGSSRTTLEWRGVGLSGSMSLTGLALSLSVNALATGLIVFKIFKVFQEVKITSDDKILSATGGSKFRRIILVFIESAMMLFFTQLARILVYNFYSTTAASRVYDIITVFHQMLNGITPTIILVRISMGLSFHDEKSMEEFAIGSLRFASNHPDSVPEMGSIDSVGGESGDDDDIDAQRSNDIGVVER